MTRELSLCLLHSLLLSRGTSFSLSPCEVAAVFGDTSGQPLLLPGSASKNLISNLYENSAAAGSSDIIAKHCDSGHSYSVSACTKNLFSSPSHCPSFLRTSLQLASPLGCTGYANWRWGSRSLEYLIDV